MLAYFFQAGVQFSARNARGTVLSEVSWDCAMFVDLKYQTYQPKTKYNHSNNKYSPKWNSAVLLQEGFCREFTHFLAYFFQASICAGVQKMTNIRYAPYQCSDQLINCHPGWTTAVLIQFRISAEFQLDSVPNLPFIIYHMSHFNEFYISLWKYLSCRQHCRLSFHFCWSWQILNQKKSK